MRRTKSSDTFGWQAESVKKLIPIKTIEQKASLLGPLYSSAISYVSWQENTVDFVLNIANTYRIGMSISQGNCKILLRDLEGAKLKENQTEPSFIAVQQTIGRMLTGHVLGEKADTLTTIDEIFLALQQLRDKHLICILFGPNRACFCSEHHTCQRDDDLGFLAKNFCWNGTLKKFIREGEFEQLTRWLWGMYE